LHVEGGFLAGSCGAFCSFCGKCGRRIDSVVEGIEVPVVAPPGMNASEVEASDNAASKNEELDVNVSDDHLLHRDGD
jgi:hypothetical protein